MVGQMSAWTSLNPDFCGKHQRRRGGVLGGLSVCKRSWLIFFVPKFIISILTIANWMIATTDLSIAPVFHNISVIAVIEYFNNGTLFVNVTDLSWEEEFITAQLEAVNSVGMVIAACVLVTSLALNVLNFTFLLNLRMHMRKRYNIPGTYIGDCLTLTLCEPCAVAQMYRHVYRHGDKCQIFHDPGPHDDVDGVRGQQTGTVTESIKSNGAE